MARTRPGSPDGPRTGALSGVPRPQPGYHLRELKLSDARHQHARVPKQFPHTAGRTVVSAPGLLLSRANHQLAALPRHQVYRRPRGQPPGRNAAPGPDPWVARSRRICPLTGRTGGRYFAGTPLTFPELHPAARTTKSAPTSLPSLSRTPMTRPAPRPASPAPGVSRAPRLRARRLRAQRLRARRPRVPAPRAPRLRRPPRPISPASPHAPHAPRPPTPKSGNFTIHPSRVP